MSLRDDIQKIWNGEIESDDIRIQSILTDLLDGLERGEFRAAERDSKGNWQVHAWVKQGILLVFRGSTTVSMGETSFASFRDRAPLTPRHLDQQHNVRLVPGGSAVRRGSFVASGVTIMPPAYINVGAYVDSDSMIDSHALVGSCAQIGSFVHISAAAQIGGVLEPVGARPVIVEDHALVGGGCGLYEGVLVGEGAVLASGLILTVTTPIFDTVHDRVLRGTPEDGLIIPPGAVVVPGARRVKGMFAEQHGLGMACGIIVKYRDTATDKRVRLERLLRESES